MFSIQGLNTGIGLASTNHVENLYRRLLRKFFAHEGSFAADVIGLMDAHSQTDAIRRAHDLRATAATLGATAVGDEARLLEEAMLLHELDATQLVDLVSNVDRALTPLLAHLAPYVSTSPAARTARKG